MYFHSIHYSGEPYCDLFQNISAFCDPGYAFFVYPPLFYALCQNSGRAMLLVVVITEWANMVLKWILLGHRPYWWVLENMTVSTYFLIGIDFSRAEPAG